MTAGDDVRVEAIPAEERVEALKADLRKAVWDYRRALDPSFPGGANVQAYLNTGLATKARRVNAIARELRALDASFPSAWTDLPEGT